MTQRVLISDDGTTQVYRVNDDSGNRIGTDVVTTPTTAQTNAAMLQAAVLAAIAGNITYIGTASPTAAQTTVQVKALSRQMDALIKLTFGQTDTTDGT